METNCTKSYFVHFVHFDFLVQNAFSSRVLGTHVSFPVTCVFHWDTRGKTKDSESSFVASAQYLERSSSHPDGHVGHVAVDGGDGDGGVGHPHQSYQPQH